LVDIGDYAEIKEHFLEQYSLQGVFLTHTHFDHIYGLNELLEDYPDVPVYTNAFGKKGNFIESLYKNHFLNEVTFDRLFL